MALILIADNSAPERQRLREMMEANDCIVVEADNRSYCLEIIEVHRLDAALLNPFLSGTETIESEVLQALQSRKIPTIALAKDNEKEVRQHCLKYEIFAVIEKFISAFELQETIAKALVLQSLPPIPKPVTIQASSEHKQNDLEELFDINILKNVISIGIEAAQATLNELTDSPIHFEPAIIEPLNFQSLQDRLQKLFGCESVSVAQLPFSGGFSGTSQLFFLTDSADLLTQAITGEEPGSVDFDLTKTEMLTEIGNIVLNGIMGSMSNAVTKSLQFSVPNYVEDTIENLLLSHLKNNQTKILFARAGFSIEELQVTGDIILFF